MAKNREKSFLANAAILASGAAGGQLIVLLASPILTRLYSPEDFGVLAVFGAILSILGVVSALRYEQAIPLPKCNEEAKALVLISLFILIITTLLSGCLVYYFGEYFSIIFNAPQVESYLWLLPVGLFFLGGYQVLQQWGVRRKEFRLIAKTRFLQSLTMTVIQLSGASYGALSLIIGRVFSQGFGIISLSKVFFSSSNVKGDSKKAGYFREMAIKYSDFPLLSSWTGLTSALGSALPSLLIASTLGVASAGVFSLTHRVLSQPMMVLGKALGDVFYQEAAEAYHIGNLGARMDNVFKYLAGISFPLGLTAFIIAPEAFVFVFGPQWALAGDVARWIVPWMLFQFIVTPATRVYPIIGKHRIALLFQLSLVLSSIISVLIGGWYFKDIVVTIIILSSINSLIYIIRVFITYFLVCGDLLRPLNVFLKSAVFAFLINVPLMIPVLFFDGFFVAFEDGWGVVFLYIFLLSLYYYHCLKNKGSFF